MSGRSSTGNLISWILIIICAMVFCGSAAHLLMYAKDKLDAEKDFSQIRENARDLSMLYDMNHDLVGWVKIEGTKIDYPVMQTKEDPEFYLHRNFKGEYSESGVPFLDGTSVVVPCKNTGKDTGEDTDEGNACDLETTWNWLIYGHNMKFGTMFHDLMKYDSKKFWKKHRTFTFDVYYPDIDETDHGVYEIFAASRSEIRAEDSDAFKYYQYAGYTDEETFQIYVDGVKAESSYDTGITPEFGEQLVTLSTCAYHTNEGRMYIAGRRIE